jgi:hypothetical protein
VLAALEGTALIMVHGRDRLIVAGALAGSLVSLGVIGFGLARLHRLVDRISDPPGSLDADQSWFTAQMLEDFPMDRLRPELLASPGLHLNTLYAAWSCAVMGRDAAWLQDRFTLEQRIAEVLAQAAAAACEH